MLYMSGGQLAALRLHTRTATHAGMGTISSILNQGPMH
jgi:hypothetical protein